MLAAFIAEVDFTGHWVEAVTQEWAAWAMGAVLAGAADTAVVVAVTGKYPACP